MNTKPKLAASLSAALLLATSATALADHDDGHSRRDGAQYDYAKVISSQPIVRYVTVTTPVRECWQETQYARNRGYGNGGGTLVGALIGGVIGHQIGSGRGNDAATVAGTLIGAAIGNESGRQRHGEPGHGRQVERCETRYRETQEERVDGYRVTYRYNGQKYATQMPYDPGEKIRVRVDVRPAR